MDLFETEFYVDREVSTPEGKRVDILIQEYSEGERNVSNWAIIIENKLYAGLYNDLSHYLDSIEADNKILIVLSLFPVSLDDYLLPRHCFNVLHSEIISEVKSFLKTPFP